MKKYTLLSACCYSLVFASSCAYLGSEQPAATNTASTATQTLEEMPVMSKAVAAQGEQARPGEPLTGNIVIQETGLLNDSPGFIGSEMGAKVESVSIDHEQGLKTIFILVPVDPGDIDSIEVVDHHDRPLNNVREPKLIRDYENNNVGVKLFVSPKSKIDFKLKLRSQD